MTLIDAKKHDILVVKTHHSVRTSDRREMFLVDSGDDLSRLFDFIPDSYHAALRTCNQAVVCWEWDALEEGSSIFIHVVTSLVITWDDIVWHELAPKGATFLNQIWDCRAVVTKTKGW